MLFEFLHSKIHRATITDSNLNYVGSITIDEEFLEKANKVQNVFVSMVQPQEKFRQVIKLL